MSSTTDAWEEAKFLWIGASQRKMPDGYLPLFGIKLTANTNDYDQRGAGVEGLAVNALKPARTLSANRMLWEEERSTSVEEMSKELRESFDLWTKNYCRGNREMMDRVTALFLYIFRQEEWEEIVRWIDQKVETYLMGALYGLMDEPTEQALTNLADRIVESEDVFALQINVFGMVGVKKSQLPW
jgi:hypothetical protein